LCILLESLDTEEDKIQLKNDINKRTAELKIIVNQTYRYLENCHNNTNFRTITFTIICFGSIGGVFASFQKLGLRQSYDNIINLFNNNNNILSAILNLNNYKTAWQELSKREIWPVLLLEFIIINIGISAAYQLISSVNNDVYFKSASKSVNTLKDITSTIEDTSIDDAKNLNTWLNSKR